MTTPSMKYKLPKELRHIELGKTLVNKDLFFEAFDHFKKSIESNPDCAIDILTYLYKKQLHKKTHINIELIIAKIYIEMNLFNEAFDVFEETLEENPHHETTYETLAKLITRKQLTSKIKHAFETAISNNIYFPCIINILPKIYLEEKNYTKAISLYNKLIEIGLMESMECGKAHYDSYIRNGLMLQLRRIELGDNIEQDHMRNRQLVAAWAYKKGQQNNVIEKKTKDGKTFFIINDYKELQNIFGQLLREIQRITSEGDFEAGKKLVENYGVQVDRKIHEEVLNRSKKFNSAPYGGFINPKYSLVIEDNEIIDVKIEYPDDFETQMMEYARDYSFLPNTN